MILKLNKSIFGFQKSTSVFHQKPAILMLRALTQMAPIFALVCQATQAMAEAAAFGIEVIVWIHCFLNISHSIGENCAEFLQ